MNHVHLAMLPGRDVPQGCWWIEVGGEGRKHPYGIHKAIRRTDVDIVSRVLGDEDELQRVVFLNDGEYEVWVQESEFDELGYELTSDEKISDAERRAIALKHEARKDSSEFSIDEAWSIVESDESAAIPHAIQAIYSVKGNDLEELQELNRIYEETAEKTSTHALTTIVDVEKNALVASN